jgi:two-component system sensor histidine kinase KdpD
MENDARCPQARPRYCPEPVTLPSAPSRGSRTTGIGTETLDEIVHELSAPLASVGTAVDLLLDQSESSSPTEKAELLLRLRDSTRWLQELVAELGAPRARGQGRRPPRGIGPLNLCRALERASHVAQPLFRPRSQRLALSLPNRPIVVWGDEQLIRRAALNLLSNAAKYAPVADTVELRLHAGDTDAVVEVCDHGAALGQLDARGLFDAHVRGPVPAGTPGRGLGLRIVRNLVEWHGGEAGVHTQAGGTVFWFSLPRIGRRAARHEWREAAISA